MTARILRRLFLLPLLAFGAATAVFVLVHAVPGDPAAARLGEGASPADLETLRASMFLDRPPAEQYARFVGNLLRGDLGRSWHSGRPSAELIVERLPATALLAGAALLLALVTSFPAALVAASFPGGRIDRAVRTVSSGVAALPSYAVGPVLILSFAVGLGWFPASGRREPGAWFLPALTLAIPMAAQLVRILRASLDDELAQPYLRAARARGIGPARLIGKHALANVLLPVSTVIGLQLGSLLTGALVTETLFSWPGIGRLLVEAIRRRDQPLVVATVFVFALVYLFVNLLVDLFQLAADPRARQGESS